MPVTHAKAPSAATRFPPASQTEPAVASKKKKKKKGKGKAQDGSNPSNHVNHADHDGIDDEEDDLGPVNPTENELNGRRSHDTDHADTINHSNAQTAPLNAASHGQLPLRMSTTATAQAELLAAANELYKRMETEQMANDANDGEYWKQLPSHIRSFVETTYAHGAALSPNERSKSQAMLALAQTMVDEATSRFPAGGFPPPFDPSLLSDPKFAEKLGMKHGGLGAMNLMREYADEAYDDYNSENEDDDIDDDQQYEADDSSKKKRKKKKKGAAVTMTNGTTPHPNPLPPLIPLAPNPAAAVTRVAPSAAQPRPSSRAAGKQPVYSQPTVPPARTTRSTATKSPVPPNPYNHGYAKSAVTNGTSTLAKRPTGGGDKDARSKLWSSSTEQDRERIKEFWLGLSDVERRDLVKLEKEAVLKKMKEQQKHSCSCAVCGRKRNAIEEELEVLYDAYYEELEQYANHQQQYQSSGGKITPPPGPGPFPGSVAYDKNGAVIGGPPGATKHPARGTRPAINGTRGRKAPPESDDEYEDEYEEDEDEYEDEEDEEEDDDDDDDDSNTRKVASRRRDLPPRAPLSRRPNGREDFFNFGNLTTAGPGNILTVADDLLKNDGGKFLEMMEQLAERRMQREEDAAKEVEVDSEEDEDDPEGSEEEDEDDEDNDDESEEEEDDPMSEEQKMEEGRKMFSIFAARMFEQRVLNAYREKVAAERQQQLLRELEDEDKVQAERDAKRQKENQKKKDKKKQQKQAKEAEKAKKDAEKANEEAAARAKAEAHEEEMKKKREEERLKREQERKQKEEEKARLAEERRQRIEEQKAIELQRKKEKEERERKERLVRQEREAQAKAERAERERKAKEERTLREVKEREERERREKEEKERKERERLEQAKAEERRKQEALNAAKAKASAPSTSPRAANYPASSQVKKTTPNPTVKPNGPLLPSQRPVTSPMNRPPQMQPQSQPILGSQRPMMNQGQGMPINIQLPPNMGIPPLGMTPTFNSMVSPIAMSPRISYGPPSATGVGHGPFSPLTPFAQGQGQPGLINGASMQQYSFDAQSPLMPQSQPTMQPSRPPSTLPSTLAMQPPKTPATPTSNGIPPIGVPPGASSASAAHIRRASAQANPSPFGAIGKPRGAPSSIVGDDDRGLQPPSPDRVLGSSALVDENDTIVELPKRRGTAGRIDTIGAPAAVGSRWGPRAPSWPAPNGPGPVGMQWSAAPGRPQPNRLDSPFSPT